MIGKIRRAIEAVQKRQSAKALILMYHRIAAVDSDPWGLCVTPQHFAAHLDILQKHAHPISLQQLAEAHQANNIPDRAVVITFDDGYADNLYQAKPLLEQYHIPATVFITTGQIGSDREFWWDELERVLLQPGELPETLCLNIAGKVNQWQLGKATRYSLEEYKNDRDRKAWQGQPGSRLAFYYAVWQQLRPLPVQARQQVQDEILNWAGATPAARSNYRSLSLEELRTLSQGGLATIGAHTVNHLMLSVQPVHLQQQEIQQSKAYLEQVLAQPVTSFAYPYGDYAQKTVPLIPTLGFTCACSTSEATVWRGSDCFQFPRIAIENWHQAEFLRHLLKWLPN